MALIRIQALPVGGIQANCYLVENPATRQLLLVDPGAEGEKIIQAVGDRKPVAALATHGHFDHIGAADEVCGHFGIPLYLHEADLPKLTDSRLNGSARFAEPLVLQTPGIPLQDGQRLTLAGMEITVLHTPGHSAGSCCFLLPEGQGVLTGDTLFDGGYGRTDFEDGSFAQIKESLRRLLALTPKMTAYPGHGGSAFAGRDEEPL
ncbi:MAG: MBL fold metallo-hydrolase [Candidatus Limiplasma sp.]|nr:MBL fold metallo-hydrolase [Candidatus Limiplasma sp.]